MENKKILVAEDSPILQDEMKKSLDEAGYEVATADNGLVAWELAQNAVYDMVITDINMPELDGFQLAEKLRSLSTYDNIPIYATTTRSSPEDRAHGKNIGITLWLVKPVSHPNLLKAIEIEMERAAAAN